MRWWILFVCSALILSYQLNAQVYYDSLNNKDFLYENSYLSSSSNILTAYSKGFSIENVSVSAYDNFGVNNADSIVSIELKENHLSILVYTNGDGCKNFFLKLGLLTILF